MSVQRGGGAVDVVAAATEEPREVAAPYFDLKCRNRAAFASLSAVPLPAVPLPAAASWSASSSCFIISNSSLGLLLLRISMLSRGSACIWLSRVLLMSWVCVASFRRRDRSLAATRRDRSSCYVSDLYTVRYNRSAVARSAGAVKDHLHSRYLSALCNTPLDAHPASHHIQRGD